jgi:hypothetical protein
LTTRWFVEVSRVDADTQKERYCVEALQWQQALQQARKLRGDRGALSRFAIELLESGYRATDPVARLRYTISKAPSDAPLSGGAPTNGASKAPAAVSIPAVAVAVAQAAPAPAVPRFDLPKPPSYSKPPLSKSSPPPRASSPPAPEGASPGPIFEIPRRPSGKNLPTSPAVPKPRRSTRPPKVTVKKPPSVAPTESSPEPSAAKALPLVVPRLSPSGTPAPAAADQPVLTPTTELTELDPMTGPAVETAPQVPGLELVAMRKEEPTEAVPITYREYSFALAAGAEPHELERHARAAWEQVRDAIRHRASQKFVQIALFDHHFEGRPSRPPLAVLAWKDWRGDPVVQIRGAGAPSVAPASSASILPRPAPPKPAPVASAPPPEPLPTAPTSPRVSTVPSFPAPQAVLSSPSPVSAGRHTSPHVVATAVTEPAFPAASVQPAPSVEVAPAAEPVAAPTKVPAARAVSAAPPTPEVAIAPTVSFVQAAPPPAVEPLSAPPAAEQLSAPIPAASPSQEPSRGRLPSRPGTGPQAGRRRGSSEDLIGELFEQVHSLHFAPDIVSGAEYVLNVMLRVMPSEGAIVHVFDINTRQFVVVRAAGPNSRNVLLYRTPDTYRLFRSLFRKPRALAVADASEDLSFQSDRWERLGVRVKSALAGAVKHGGRYLGVIELANPAGGGVYHETEVNALDYICGQFADFVASRPIVIDEDAVLPKT